MPETAKRARGDIEAIENRRGSAGNPSQNNDRAYLSIERCADIILSLAASIVFAPLIIVCMFLIVCKDPGNPVYLHKRVGFKGKPIKVMKLRTMRKEADQLEKMLPSEQLEEYRKEYKVDDDPRLIGWEKVGDGKTCFGAWLRRFSLDELPQLFWNVLLKGDMALLGPRPILEEELKENYTPEQRNLLLSVKPGITGFWQVYGRNNARYEEGIRQQMELFYVTHRNLRDDIKIMLATVITVLKGKGAK